MTVKFKKSKDMSPLVLMLGIPPIFILLAVYMVMIHLGMIVTENDFWFNLVLAIYFIGLIGTFFIAIMVPRISVIDLDSGDIETSYFGIKHKLNIKDIQEIKKEPIYYHCSTFGFQYKYIFIKGRLKIEVGDISGYYDQFDLLAEKVPQWINEYNIKYEEVK